ncbi:MAG: phosphoglucosamine mutase [Ruminococcus sp.]|jgi:phosphoglucosamine mutase|nr:phosphoglucosamine mutase [Ruminococcus sp.]
MGKLFGTDGARGIAITELTCETAMAIGRASALVLAEEAGHSDVKFIIGKDTRISSDVLEAALAAGIASVGGSVYSAGVIPTPGIAYLVKEKGFTAGIVISASHNSMEYNGIKLFSSTGFKLPDETEDEIEELIFNKPERLKTALKSNEKVGRIFEYPNAAAEYSKHLLSILPHGFSADGMRIALDCANGASSTTAEMIFGALGAKVFMINASPNGSNINAGCGSTHMDGLIRFVGEKRCDIGLAFDGDADRCLAVDETGAIIDGDRLIALCAKSMAEEGTLKKNTAVVTVMTNMGFLEFAEKNDINVVSTKVGDRYIIEQMADKGYNLGGEQSGHIIFTDFSTTGDGELTGLKVIEIMRSTGKKLSELAEVMTVYPQTMMNVKIPQHFREIWKNNPDIEATIKNAEQALGKNGRILVRESGTEPLIRVMAEGKVLSQINELVMGICNTIESKITSQALV